MLRFAADENFNNHIVRGLWRRESKFDIIRIQDVGLSGADDPTVLEWAAHENRVLLTHDVSTVTHLLTSEFAPDSQCRGYSKSVGRFQLDVSSKIFCC